MAAAPRLVWLLAPIALLAGCMTKAQAIAMRTGQGEAMPAVEVRPGVAERLALMDEYRLHDETRKLMMRRPHVTIEELPPDEPAPEEATSDADGAKPAEPTAGADAAPRL